MEKKILPAFLPARLVIGHRWYIVWYAPSLDSPWKRYRETFKINRIKNIQLRKKRGEALVEKINWWLEQGWKAWKFDESMVPKDLSSVPQKAPLGKTPILIAIEKGKSVISISVRDTSFQSYKSMLSIFEDYLREENLNQLQIADFSKVHAINYMDHCVEKRKLGAWAYNNNLRILRMIFNKLVDRGYLEKNPFLQIASKKKTKKKRRNFSNAEAKIVISHIQANEPLLFLALLMEYACLIRPSEMRKLRISDIDLSRGIIKLEDWQTKIGEGRIVTIPDAFQAYFQSEFLKKPPHWFLFGSGFQPARDKPCGKNTMGQKHRSILIKLKKEGKLGNIEGLTWYSWKDTGITDALDQLPLLSVQEHAGHADPEMTLRYRHKQKINKKIKEGLKNTVL